MRHFFLNKWFILFFLSAILSSQVSNAQFDAQYSQYMMVPGYFNPGSICETGDLNISLTSRQQWVSIENAPSTFIVNATMPRVINNKVHGFGLILMKESIGLFNNQMLQIQYSMKKDLFGGKLGMGIQGGLLQQNFDADKIYIPTSDYHTNTDASIPNGILEGLIPDFSIGVWYNKDKFFSGLSASHILESKIKLKSGEENSADTSSYNTYASRTYYLTGGYNIALTNPLYTLQPSFLVKTDLTAWQTDLSVKLSYKGSYWGYAGWRPGDAIIVSAGIILPQGLTIGYSYDVSVKALSSVSGGSHEIFLGFRKKIDTATVSKKQKSVRIL